MSEVVKDDELCWRRVTYVLLHQTSGVTDSKNEVTVKAFVQRESTSWQPEVQVIQRSKIDLQREKKKKEDHILSLISRLDLASGIFTSTVQGIKQPGSQLLTHGAVDPLLHVFRETSHISLWKLKSYLTCSVITK